MSRLVYYMDHYGAELEADFQEKYGLELGRLWRARQWARILRLANRLPRASRFVQASSNDEEHVRALQEAMAQSDKPRNTGPALSEWTQEAEILAVIADLVQQNGLIAMTAAGAKNAGRLRPYPRPQTAWESVRHERGLENYRELMGKVKASQQRRALRQAAKGQVQ